MPGHGPVPATAGHGDIEAADRCDRATGMSLSVVTMAPGRLNLTRKVAAGRGRGPAAAVEAPARRRARNRDWHWQSLRSRLRAARAGH